MDDPRDFGAIAAANALSDVYAMGGRPLSALNLVGFPATSLGPEVLVEILRGGADKAKEAGIEIVGGHTLQTDEPIYGLAVTGTVHPDRMVTNATARDGNLLVLTKPLGVGIVCTAAKNDWDHEDAIGEAIAQMSTLNRAACEAMLEVGVHAATDVTGFGLLGHLRNLLLASGLGATIWLDAVPCIAAAPKYAAEGVAPGGTHRNRRFLAASVEYEESIDEASAAAARRRPDVGRPVDRRGPRPHRRTARSPRRTRRALREHRRPAHIRAHRPHPRPPEPPMTMRDARRAILGRRRPRVRRTQRVHAFAAQPGLLGSST